MKYNKYMPQTGIKCPAITRKGKSCPIGGEEWRNGWCHVHDPNGEMVNKTKRKAKAFSLEYNLREIIARDIESQCPVLIQCDCPFHYAAEIARGNNV